MPSAERARARRSAFSARECSWAPERASHTCAVPMPRGGGEQAPSGEKAMGQSGVQVVLGAMEQGAGADIPQMDGVVIRDGGEQRAIR